MTAHWSDLVREAFLEALRDAPDPRDVVDGLPEALHRKLRDHGFAIHDRRFCVRLPQATTQVGREMSPEEMELLGVTPEEEPIDQARS